MKKKSYFVLAVVILTEVIVMLGLVNLLNEKNSAGDINDDGIIDISDYTMLKLDLIGAKRLSIKDLKRADINNDGYADQADLDLMRSAILEQEP